MDEEEDISTEEEEEEEEGRIYSSIAPPPAPRSAVTKKASSSFVASPIPIGTNRSFIISGSASSAVKNTRSVATTFTPRSSKKKSDPVNRYHQLQRIWSRDRFLSGEKQGRKRADAKTASSTRRVIDTPTPGGPSRVLLRTPADRVVARGTTRGTPASVTSRRRLAVASSPVAYVKPGAARRSVLCDDYRGQLKAAHKSESRMQKERKRRDHRRVLPSDYVVPSEKRRDALRWNVRCQMIGGGGRAE